MSRELLQRVHEFLSEFSGDAFEMQEAEALSNDIDRELAKPEPQPVARVSEGLRLEWVCTQAAAKALKGQKLYPRDGV